MPGLVPGIHVFGDRGTTWMAGTSPAMTRRQQPSQALGLVVVRQDKGEDTSPYSRGAFRPSLVSHIALSKVRGRKEGRVAAAPGALAQKKLRKRESTGTGGDHTGLPCAMVYGL